MKSFYGVNSTVETVKEVEVNKDTVYIRSNITRIETEDFTGWQYDEVQYDYQEYLEIQDSEKKELQDKNDILLLEILKMKM